jgi:lysozyme
MPRRINPAGLRIIQEFEGCRLEAYECLGSLSNREKGRPPFWTVGWGHTGPDVHEGLIITKERADELLVEDLRRFERDVESLVTNKAMTDNQFAALVSFAYNVGSDIDKDDLAEGLGDSSLLRKFNAGDMSGAADEFPKWNKSGGRVLPGLVRRRAAERLLFLS